MTVVTHNAGETERLARNLAGEARPGAVFCLSGYLGAGKTVFARGFAQGLGITGDITSPTFCILNEYTSGRLPLYHFDVYRIGDAEEMDDVCAPDYFYGQGVCLIEWAENINDIIPDGAVWINIVKKPDIGDNVREITVDGREGGFPA